MKPIRYSKAARAFSLSLLTASLASCAHLNDNFANDPFLSEKPVITAKDWPKPKQSDSGSAKSIEGIPLPVNSSEGPVVANHLEIRQVPAPAPEAEPASQPIEDAMISPASGEVTFQLPGGPPAEWCPPGSQFPAMQVSPEMCPSGHFPGGMFPAPPVVPAWIGGAAIAPVPALFPDEYLCDGGDREYPVRYDADMRLGLDTEDTVVEYTDHAGGMHVKPTNRVCVYAPRFGAVRSISSPVLDTAVDMIASADKFDRGAGMRNQDVWGMHKQNTVIGKYRTRERASDIDVDSRPSGFGQTQVLAGFDNVLNTFEDLQFVQSGLLTQTDEVRLAKGVQAAVVWTRTQFPIVAAQTEQAQEVMAEFRAQELVGKEDRRKPGRLRIVKLADKAVAQPGDIVTFTIRYDNLGDLELSAIRIIDNLTPRLQYVEDSETSDRAGQLLLQDNEEGSLILEFHLDDPLPGKQGGVVTFQARVR